MYLIEYRFDEIDVNDVSLFTRVKMIIINLWILLTLTIDLIFIKNIGNSAAEYNFFGLYALLGYYILVEAYALYRHYATKPFSQIKHSKQTSYIGTFMWHFISFLKMGMFGFGLSSVKEQFVSTYFFTRFSIYASSFFLIVSHLSLVKYFILKKDEWKEVQIKLGLWQLQNFNKVFYAGLLGITVDIVSFGSDINFYFWITLTTIWLVYQFNNLMTAYQGWKMLKHIFDSQ